MKSYFFNFSKIVFFLLFYREMLNCESVDTLVGRHEVLQSVGLVLIKYSAKWREAKTHEDILMNITRLLYDYSRFKHAKSVLFVKEIHFNHKSVFNNRFLVTKYRRW